MKKLIVFITLLLIFVTSCNSNQIDDEAAKLGYTNKVSLVAVGDSLIHKTIYEAAKNDQSFDFSPMLKEIKPYIKSFDLAFINQETILGGEELGLSTYPCFNSPFELGDALVDAGFNLFSIANNHTLDRGEEAVLNAINFLNNKGVIYSGAVDNEYKSQHKIFEVNGIKFGFVAYTYGTNGIKHPKEKKYLANVYSDEKAKRDVELMRDKVDIVIVSMHWGDEYQTLPSETQINQAKYLSDLNVDIIIGHHPHVIQPVDMIENKNGHKTFVIYSLGNFLSDQNGIDKLIGMAISVDIYKKDSTDNIEIDIKNPQARLLYRYKDFENNKFLVKLFNNLDNTLLYDYRTLFENKQKLIQTYYPKIIVN